MAGYTQPVMSPGPIHYKRKYTLWVLILLVLICWPAAIIYYFTRDKVPVQEMQTYAMPLQGGSGYAPSPGTPPYAPAPGPTGSAPTCPRCGKPATWVAQQSRWYCYTDQQYL